MRRSPNLVAAIVIYWASACLGAISPEIVVVGDPGNEADTRYASPGFGDVGYAYGIGKYEVTTAQYTAFLNAVAATDTYGVYNPLMWTSDVGCKIERAGDPDSYRYSVTPDRANRPVNFVSFWDACRFANWLDNGQPSGAQDATTTEDGAYTLNGYKGTDGTWIHRNADATWVIPTEHEWYKAAFYKGGGTNAGYWDYPTQTDLTPSNDLLDPDPGNNANFWQADYTIGSPYWTTEAGEFENSDSPYGTFDQGGNVWEWNETLVSGSERGMRGGGYPFDSHMELHLHASNRGSKFPEETSQDEFAAAGFRVAYVPEPSTVLMLTAASLLLPLRRKRYAV